MLSGIALLVSALGLAMGQEPTTAQGQPEASRCYMKKAVFNLPINLNDAVKSQIREIRLFGKTSADGSWGLLQKCPPTQPAFKFQAEKDGEYWFTIAMIDLDGVSIPADPEQSQHRMVVVVDKQSPSADVQLVQAASEGQVIQVDARDPNLDPKKTEVYYQTRDQLWRLLDPIPQQTNRYCIPIQAATTGLIRVSAADLAGNVMRRDYDLTQSNVGQGVPETGGSIAKNGPTGAALELTQATRPTEPLLPAPENLERPFASPDRITGTKPVVAEAPSNLVRILGSDLISKSNAIEIRVEPTLPVVAPQGVPLAPEQRPVGPVTPGTTKATPPAPALLAKAPAYTPPPEYNPLPVPSPMPAPEYTPPPAEKVSSPVSVDRQLINHRQVMLAYKVEDVGTSGIGKVEIWLTKDVGKSWQKFCEDPHRKSPLAVELPGEGLFGITLVVSNGRGFGSAPPKSGDVPDAWVEVDLTRPAAKVTGVRAGSGEDSGALFISWTAADRNLPTDSVELFYSSSRDGNWQSIGRGLANEGTHRWVPPTSFGPQAFLRLVVRDLAGNTTVVETPQPVTVDDLSRPRGRLVEILPYSPEIRLDPMGN